jgi:uncharacterized phage protein (TIGR01671 family)
MREIKFRAWNGKRMVEPFVISFERREAQIETSRTEPASSGNTYIGHGWVPLASIMQFTGLKDKNGKEIYEWDIVRSIHGSDVPVAVKWGLHSDDSSHAKSLGYIVGDCLLGTDVDGREGSYLEVIGNVWENPDLLQ